MRESFEVCMRWIHPQLFLCREAEKRNTRDEVSIIVESFVPGKIIISKVYLYRSAVPLWTALQKHRIKAMNSEIMNII